MAREREVKVVILGDDRSGSKALKSVAGEAGQTESKFSQMGSTLAKVVGGGALLSFANSAKNMASDVAEAASKVGVVFGESRVVVDQFAATSAKAFGISKGAALEATGTFGNLFTATGLAKDAAAGMSVDVVKLAADLGSFNNLGTDEVLEKLRSGLVGEVEPLRALGINFNAAAVEAKAMEMGLADANGEISEGAKVQARYALILEQTKTAQGDFARTADGMANSSKIAAASAQDTSAKFGDVLAPAMAKANAMLSAGLELFNGLPGPLQQVTIGVGLLSAAVVLVAGRTAAWSAVTTVATGAQWLLNAALTANPIGVVVVALGLLAAALVVAYQKSETVRDIVGALGGAFIAMKNVAVAAIQIWLDVYMGAIEWIVKGAAAAFGWVPKIGPALREAAGAVEGFRDDVNYFLDGIRDKTVTVTTVHEAVYVTRGDRTYGGDSTAGIGQYHTGGIVPGTGDVPILAEGGEGVFTPEQMAAIGKGFSRRDSMPMAGYDPIALAKAIAAELAPFMQMRQAGVTVHMNEKADPMHLAREIAWAMG